MRKFGLLGKNISYSFSRNYFENKFENENIHNVSYENFDIPAIENFPVIVSEIKNLMGLNVTIPYKETIIPYLDKLDPTAKTIGAVNTIKITKKGLLKGYNTDYYGFKKSIKPLLKKQHKKALVLGTGGASKAVAYALDKLGIKYRFVSRTPNDNALNYESLNKDLIASHLIIINCTPLGTFPNITNCPNIPYNFLTKDHILYDLIYNPEESQFLKNGIQKGCTVINGLKMLELQAEKSWKIWNR